MVNRMLKDAQEVTLSTETYDPSKSNINISFDKQCKENKQTWKEYGGGSLRVVSLNITFISVFRMKKHLA